MSDTDAQWGPEMHNQYESHHRHPELMREGPTMDALFYTNATLSTAYATPPLERPTIHQTLPQPPVKTQPTIGSINRAIEPA
ncbi:Hypothetical predicted protein [Pelobates cultripes]|uniref:Uncharacterized protein n=1 Tax=Pelobates cultripes TaxID=61616 RepID=A0AAD1W172_PELCU|nr:Hypothetical predicted protein [Pelobates cultripes]